MNRRFHGSAITLTVSAICLVCLIACGSESSTLEPHPEDGQPTYEQFVAARSFPYDVSESRQHELTTAYVALSLGMSKSSVLRMLGPPDYSMSLYSKEFPGHYVSGKWTYFLSKPDPDLVNEKMDRAILVYFDRNDNAEWIIPHNVPGLTELGGPGGS